MTVEHRLLAHQPDSACGVSLFKMPGRLAPAVVVTELPDNPGVPLDEAMSAAANKVCRAYLKGASLDQVDWVYRKETRGREMLVHLRLNRGGGITSWRSLDNLAQLLGGNTANKQIIPHFDVSDILCNELTKKTKVSHVASG